MSSLLRNLKMHFRRLVNRETITIDGVIVTTDPKVVNKAVRDGLFKEKYEEPERILVRDSLKNGDRVLEVGGGVGFVSLLCAKICGAENLLIYEANPAMAPLIEKNFGLNGLAPNLRSRAITAKGDEVSFFMCDNIISSSLYEREGSIAQKIPADAFDTVIQEWKPTALVMDVEGAEVDILTSSNLEGLTKLILESHPHIVGDEEIQRLKNHLARVGFREGIIIHNSSFFSRQC